MMTSHALGWRCRPYSPRCAAPVPDGVGASKNFWHRLEGKTEMNVLTKAPESQFAYVVLAARRARQIMAGAPPMLEKTRTLKPTRPACEELEHRLVGYHF